MQLYCAQSVKLWTSKMVLFFLWSQPKNIVSGFYWVFVTLPFERTLLVTNASCHIQNTFKCLAEDFKVPFFQHPNQVWVSSCIKGPCGFWKVQQFSIWATDIEQNCNPTASSVDFSLRIDHGTNATPKHGSLFQARLKPMPHVRPKMKLLSSVLKTKTKQYQFCL